MKAEALLVPPVRIAAVNLLSLMDFQKQYARFAR